MAVAGNVDIADITVGREDFVQVVLPRQLDNHVLYALNTIIQSINTNGEQLISVFRGSSVIHGEIF